MINTVLNLIFPPICMICNNIISIDKLNKFQTCENCTIHLKLLHEYDMNLCDKCSRPTIGNTCKTCIKNENLFTKNYSLFMYDDGISIIIKNLKYRNNPIFAKILGIAMGEYAKKFINIDIDYLIPVPMHYKKQIKRGFNQAEILCKYISKVTKIKYIKDFLVRKYNTTSQSSVSYFERTNNVKDAFCINKKYKKNFQNVMIIDDIFTSGSTINACAKELKAYGCKNVYSFCLAIVKK